MNSTTARQKTARKMALFIIFLVLTLPIYSASAMAASLQITRNSGSAGIKGFLDANGDTWQVDVNIADAPELPSPEQVTLNVGTKSQKFDSCSESPVGFSCSYVSPLPITLSERAYEFRVKYVGDPFDPTSELKNPSTTGIIKADGTAPSVADLNVHQLTGTVSLDFKVQDGLNNLGSGIKTIEILDADTNTVLQAINIERPLETQRYQYSQDTRYSGRLESELTGEGRRRLKVRAFDQLGHVTATPPVKAFDTDFIAPQILTATARLVDSNNFVGIFERFGTFEVNISETNLITTDVTLSAESTNLDLTPGSCASTDTEGIFNCRWLNVRLSPQSSYILNFHARDSNGNEASASTTINLIEDITPPEVIFFGTTNTFDDQSYVTFSNKNFNQSVILIAQEQGSGISVDTVAANLAQLGGGSLQQPDICYHDGTNYRCEWGLHSNSLPGGDVVITLPKFQDAVDNVGSSREAVIRVDTGGPVIDKIAFYGVSEAGDKDYFQSNDILKIKFNATEQSGLNIYVDMKPLIGYTEAQQQFPELYTVSGQRRESGFAKFDHTLCERKIEKNENGEELPTFVWECEIETTSLRSGPDHPSFDLFIRDTAGNDAQKWNYEEDSRKLKNMDGRGSHFSFELLGLAADEESPDFWQVKSASPTGFIDLETTNLVPARMPIKVELSSKINHVEAIDIRIQGCTVDTSADPKSGTPSVVNVGSQKAADAASKTEATPDIAETAAANLQISRAILFGAPAELNSGTTSPNYKILLEFAPFDGKAQFKDMLKRQKKTDNSIDIPIICNVQIFSKIGANAIRNAEQESVTFTVPFSFSKLGAMDENLKKRINNIKDETGFKILDAISIITKILDWLKWITVLVQVTRDVLQIINLFQGGTDAMRSLPIVGTLTAVGLCTGLGAAQQQLPQWLDYVMIPVNILSCNPDPTYLSYYGKYQELILDAYNTATLKSQLGVASSLYDNIYVSMLGACAPGILYNLEKYRQVRCREIMCLKKEVPAGVATVKSCSVLNEYLTCKYWLGPLLELTPIALWDYILNWLKSLASVVGLARLVLQLPCIGLCLHSSALTSVCYATTFIIKVGDILNNLASAWFYRPSITHDPYCSQI